MASFSIEEDDTKPAAYKKIHVSGCRDLRDPEVVGSADYRTDLLDLLDGYGSAESLDDLDAYLAPCARAQLRG